MHQYLQVILLFDIYLVKIAMVNYLGKLKFTR